MARPPSINCIMLFAAAVSLYALYFILNPSVAREIPSESWASIPLEYQQRCRFGEIPFEGEEARVDTKKYTLRGAAIVFRHGERSSMHQQDSYDCACYREEDRRAFEDLQTKINSEQFKEFVRTDPKFADFARTPHRSLCSAGAMTAEGALMVGSMGSFLRARYLPTQLFKGDHIDVKITSSQYNRTFQSALSFSNAFFEPTRFIPSVYIKASNYSFLCTSPACECSTAKMWRDKIYDPDHLKYFLSHGDEVLISALKALQSVSAFKGVHTDPLSVLDAALGHYICRRKPLPCAGKTCLSYELLNQALNETFTHGEAMFSVSGSNARKVQNVEAFSTLYYIAQMLYDLQKKQHTKIIRIFSGHDTVLIPLARVLRIPTYQEPPFYATRMVVEAYQHIDDPLLFRLLYDGVDVTRHLTFCKEKLENGLCSATLFEDYMKDFIWTNFEKSSISEVCQ